MARFQEVSLGSERLCDGLVTEDFGLQAMPEVSPLKWHLAHTAWYFETFVLSHARPAYRSRWPAFRDLFNSYYNGIGEQYPRPQRALLSRPTVAEVFAYRAEIRERVATLLESAEPGDEVAARGELGIQHEQQHQELMLTDLKYCFYQNPLLPAYRDPPAAATQPVSPAAPAPAWVEFPGGLGDIGAGPEGFAFDNERPAHRVHLMPFRLATAPVNNGEFLEFIADDGYRRPELWLSDGWTACQQAGWTLPLYWRRDGDAWRHFTLHGEQPLDPAAPVAHVSFYEADAFARWRGARLPTEFEWEHAARGLPVAGNFRESGRLGPAAGAGRETPRQMFGDAWEWTASSYTPYPGFQPLGGELGEYNGKFMCNQVVLRGGSCLSPRSHLRASYRNFFYPPDRWQVSGLRLAADPS